jgi:hypothetical protein
LDFRAEACDSAFLVDEFVEQITQSKFTGISENLVMCAGGQPSISRVPGGAELNR